jgi:hypothetical protein
MMADKNRTCGGLARQGSPQEKTTVGAIEGDFIKYNVYTIAVKLDTSPERTGG